MNSGAEAAVRPAVTGLVLMIITSKSSVGSTAGKALEVS